MTITEFLTARYDPADILHPGNKGLVTRFGFVRIDVLQRDKKGRPMVGRDRFITRRRWVLPCQIRKV